MNAETFASSMAYLQQLFGKSISPAVKDGYWLRFNLWDEQRWLNAIQNIIDTFIPSAQTPFPLPAHFLKSIGMDSRAVGVRAIEKVQRAISRVGAYGSVDFGDPALHSVIERYGGWVELCSWTYEDWRIKERSFIEAYESASAGGDCGPKYLAGLYELNNTASGFLSAIEPPQWFGDGDQKKLPDKEENKNPLIGIIDEKKLLEFGKMD